MKIKIICKTCNKEVEKDHWNVIDVNSSYCSRKCANINVNIKRWKDHIPLRNLYKCKVCNSPIDHRNKYKMCQPCLYKVNKEKTNNMTIKEIKRKYNEKNIRWYSSEIRNFCRMHNPDLLTKPCRNCGYDKHIELCHIKPISSFDELATIREINDKSNIIVLCPNCHWEFDNGILILKNGGIGGI